MKKILQACIFIILFSPVVHAQSVQMDYDTKTDFKKFKTYAWLAPGDSVLNRYRRDKLYGGTIMHTANLELKGRSLAMDTLKPDAVFMFFTSHEEIITYSQSPTLSVGVGVAGPGYYVAGSVPVAGGKITVNSQEDGSLKFVMYDTQTGNLVWSGTVEKKFKLSDDVEKLLVDNTVKIFKKYPVKKSK